MTHRFCADRQTELPPTDFPCRSRLRPAILGGMRRVEFPMPRSVRWHQGLKVRFIGELPRDLVECPWLPSSRSRTVKTLKEFLEERAEIDRSRADEKKAIQ